MFVFARALERLSRGEELALVTVIGASGSTPRREGAKMIASARGESEGTIGGGRVEHEAAGAAAKVAAGAPARRVVYHTVRDLAMCCGGSMELFIEPVWPARAALSEALALRAARRAGRLVTRLDGEGKRVEKADPPPEPVARGELFIEAIHPPERVFVFGGGHVGRAIGWAAAGAGFEVCLCDDDETGALFDPVPYASRVIPSFEIPDVEAEAGPLGAGDYAVIATRDHALDQRILERLLPVGALAYLGVIGSRGKLERFRRRVEAKGIATPERWAAVRGPIGLDIGADTPEEIAISVAAELVAVRRGRAP